MSVFVRFFFALMIIVLSSVYIFPWEKFGIDFQNDFFKKTYTLGLDLQGGVELDYQVDLSALKNKNTDDSEKNETVIVEGLKKIIDQRVKSLGFTEPNIQSLKYGTNTHLIVQMPTASYGNLSAEEREARQKEDIQKAKSVIGKVVNLEFRELRTETTEADYAERETMANEAAKDMESLDFSVISQKYHLPNDNILVKSGSGKIPDEAKISALANFSDENFPKIFPAEMVETKVPSLVDGAEGATVTNYVALRLEKKIAENEYEYSYVLVNKEPGIWVAAKTADGKILNDDYLTSASAYIDTNSFQPKVSLVFNDAGAKIFGEITTRMIGKQLAIFVGGQLVTAPRINDAITTGTAEISGGYANLSEAKEVADNITTGIVPAPIYLTSERTIDAKIGNTALNQILVAGLIGLVAIVIFLIIFYRVGGFLAGVALFSYAIILIAIVKMTGVTLTLSAIAGVILSIGLAIDANILIFERIHEGLKEKMPLEKSIEVGFEASWAAIWDSHITSFLSAMILFLVGVSLIKWFGFMLGVGILLSLFTAMWISRALILFVAKYLKNPKMLVGFSHKK